MRYMMVYRPEHNQDSGCSASQEHVAEMGKFVEELANAGVLLATEGLHPIAKGARVRLSAGIITVTDGPFAEAKELIAGFAIVRVSSKEEAVELAQRFLKIAGDGETEIRQVFEPTDFGAECVAEPLTREERPGA